MKNKVIYKLNKAGNSKLKLVLLFFILGLFFVFAIHQNILSAKSHISLEKTLAAKNKTVLLPILSPTPTNQTFA
ncbi:hypothetical protein HZA75_03125 [Candidatus Roizmanbacteria bacterium]|nr:hypothetical protein [Candidatus Roizmanbacteria bacterium]